ncbi:MAG: hypothetical protein HY720_10575 [Planctomycetes bacterium]|nr:hypothetical protein [Planctomycetota bacterium]
MRGMMRALLQGTLAGSLCAGASLPGEVRPAPVGEAKRLMRALEKALE